MSHRPGSEARGGRVWNSELWRYPGALLAIGLQRAGDPVRRHGLSI